MRHQPKTMRRGALAAICLGALAASGCANWNDNAPLAAREPLQLSPPMGVGPLLSEDPAYAPPRGAYGPGTVMPGGTGS